jgi:formylglycine-generating enzyme required for sulfatase activity
MIMQKWQRLIVIVVLLAFVGMGVAWTAEQTAPQFQEKEGPPLLKKHKKFPWLPVILGVGAGVVLVVLLTKKKEQTLTVSLGTGTSGTPAATATYPKGQVVAYSYSAQAGYGGLQVRLDDNVVAASGTLTMNADHVLSVSIAGTLPTFSGGMLTVNGVCYEMALIPAGDFQMGSVAPEAYPDEQPVHQVRISKAYWVGKTEVTQGLWQAVMGENPAQSNKGDNFPVESVSKPECHGFIEKLNQMIGGKAFRLPTEAEWEYACRGGITGERYGDIDAIAWYTKNSSNKTHPVGQKQPNAFGLYDMLGNVGEWCLDYIGPYSELPQTDPVNATSGGSLFIRRGSSIAGEAVCIRAARRGSGPSTLRCPSLGMRLARTNE